MLLELVAEMLALIGGLIVAYFVYVLITRKYDKSSTDSSTMAHTALREIVERAVEEARKLPGLGSYGETGRQLEARNITEHSYEDLLATAILNKVIEKFQKEQVDGNSNVLHGKPVSAIKCESETGVDEGVEEGCSSLEPLSQDDCNSDSSASCSRHVRNQPEPLSLTIEERIEEVTTTYASDEDPRDNDVLAIRNTHRVPFPELGMDIIDPSQESEDDSQDEPDTPTTHIGLVSPIESWEENWLFQKKRVQTQADPVAMLVPNPSSDFKAMIGDKDAEDTSDLSECSSAQSDEEIEKELLEAINNVVPRSPKETSLENDLDECLETSSDASTKENCSKTLSNGVQDSEKPDSRVPADTCAGNNEIARTEDFESDLEIDEVAAKEGERSETRDVEKEIEITEKVHGKLVPESTSAIEMEQQTSKDTENANVRNSSDFIENDSSNSLPEESIPDVPKTPMSTPRRTSVTEVSLEGANDSAAAIFDEERVLNSLERAKKKLMAVDDDTVETFKEIVFDQQRGGDFHAEDIQQESEYTEHYDIAIQRHLDSLTKTETSGAENGTIDESESISATLESSLAETKDSRCRKAVAVAKAESASQTSLRNKKSEEDVRLATPPRPGTIAEREHKKWENAPPIENNPYSEENIQKRLWERQYTRRSSDIPGIHAELPKSNGTDLEVVLAPQEPDIKRFGRDYYINESKSSSLEKGRRSAASTSSRPSSSLSQRSSSTGADQEQQVSFQLEKFEEASLRGSISRWTYRDPYSSPHFAINPLLRMEFDGSVTPETNISVENSINPRNEIRDSITGNGEEKEETAQLDESTNSSKMVARQVPENMSFVLNEPSGKVAYNPLYEPEIPNPDVDSGTYSIDVQDLETNKIKEDPCKRLWSNDWYDNEKDNQIVSSNGRKYWSFNGHKYHTFGGIKSCSLKFTDDSEDEKGKTEVPDESSGFEFADFGKMKFQTFGGIKRSRKIDGKGLTTYRRVKLRSSSRRNAKSARNAENDKQDGGVNGEMNENFNSLSIGRSDKSLDDVRPVESSSTRSSSDDDWQDEDVHVPDRAILTKFLKDASNKAKTRQSTDDSVYSLNTSRRKAYSYGPRKLKSLSKHRFSGNDSLKLEPPIVPEVVERTFETLKDLRGKGKKKKGKAVEKDLIWGVKSLSCVTMW